MRLQNSSNSSGNGLGLSLGLSLVHAVTTLRQAGKVEWLLFKKIEPVNLRQLPQMDFDVITVGN
jgi:hypothetical protein